jgi:uncharacterized protein YecE (DUF72 family)
MEFGKLANIDHVNWTLPPDDPAGLEFLQSLHSHDNSFRVLMGAPAWGHKEWIGQIYPPKTKSTDFLFHYSRHFDCIELNTTHYQIPTNEKAALWRSKVPENFRFCPKLYQGISHSPGGLSDLGLLKDWYRFLGQLQPNLGPCFVQFPPYFDYSSKAQLFQFLQQWPCEFELALELRHPSWFADGKILPALTHYLQKRKVGLVITDVAGRREVLHTSISADFLMLRFVGNNLHASDFSRARTWVQRFSHWKKQGLQRVFLMVHEPDDVSAPEMAEFFSQELHETMGFQHPFELLKPEAQQTSFLPS